MHRFIRAAAVVALATLAACAGDSSSIDGTTGPGAPLPPTPVGTYALKTVDGKTLPAPMGKPVVEKEYTLSARALSGQFTFDGDGSFQFIANAEVIGTGIEYKLPLKIERSGTYTFDGSTITLTSTTSGVSTMTRAGLTLTSSVSVPGPDGRMETVTMVFARQ
jgi:hypothetical protein